MLFLGACLEPNYFLGWAVGAVENFLVKEVIHILLFYGLALLRPVALLLELLGIHLRHFALVLLHRG